MPSNSQFILELPGPTATIIDAFKEAIYITSGSSSWVTSQVLYIEFEYCPLSVLSLCYMKTQGMVLKLPLAGLA